MKWDMLPCEEEFDDDDAWFDAKFDILLENGSDGFLALLIELAPYLQAPLIILMLDTDCPFAAETWLVEPNCKNVQTLYDTFW